MGRGWGSTERADWKVVSRVVGDGDEDSGMESL